MAERTDQVLAALLGPGRPEVTCDACFELLDRYVELGIAGADADAELPGMGPHLDGCPACREDHDALVALLADEPEHDALRPPRRDDEGAAARAEGDEHLTRPETRGEPPRPEPDS